MSSPISSHLDKDENDHSGPSLEPGLAKAAEDPLADVPPLTTYLVESREDKIAALQLVADSIAQQRQLAARILIFHPLVLSIYAAVLAITVRVLYRYHQDALTVLGTTIGGLTMAALLCVRYAVQGYEALAEHINFTWLQSGQEHVAEGTVAHSQDRSPGDNEDAIMVTKFGDQIIGALIIRLLDSSVSNGARRSKRKRENGAHGKGMVRAWTMKLRYRHKGVGGHLLMEGIKFVHDRLGPDAVVEFAKDHASMGIRVSYTFSLAFALSPSLPLSPL